MPSAMAAASDAFATPPVGALPRVLVGVGGALQDAAFRPGDPHPVRRKHEDNTLSEAHQIGARGAPRRSVRLQRSRSLRDAKTERSAYVALMDSADWRIQTRPPSRPPSAKRIARGLHDGSYTGPQRFTLQLDPLREPIAGRAWTEPRTPPAPGRCRPLQPGHPRKPDLQHTTGLSTTTTKDVHR